MPSKKSKQNSVFSAGLKIALLSLLSACSIPFCLAIPTTKPTGELRKFSYAPDYVTGKLELMDKDHPEHKVKDLGSVKGSFTVFVPNNQVLCLEFNPHVLENSEKLKKFPTTGIERIKLSYMSLDETAPAICTNALKTLSKFSQPIQIDCDRSDLTDEGIIGFKSLPNVKEISCFCSDVHGAFLKEAKQLQSLETLSLFLNPINEENLKGLKDLKKLKSLNLEQTNLSDLGISYVAECSGLTKLDLSRDKRITDDGLKVLLKCPSLNEIALNGDSKITDKSIATLIKFPKLTRLYLRGTAISPAGLAGLKDMKLKVLSLPKHYYEIEMVKLRKLFPNTKLEYVEGAVTEDQMVEWAPISR